MSIQKEDFMNNYIEAEHFMRSNLMLHNCKDNYDSQDKYEQNNYLQQCRN